MTTLREWKRQVNVWKKKYGDPALDLKKVDLTKIKLNRACVRCEKTKGEIHRHHKGSEFTLAQLHPDKYARRYLEFRSGDCVDLCESCHLRVHAIYYFYINEWRLDIDDPYNPSVSDCEDLRQQLIEECNRFIKKKPLKTRLGKLKRIRIKGKRK